MTKIRLPETILFKSLNYKQKIRGYVGKEYVVLRRWGNGNECLVSLGRVDKVKTRQKKKKKESRTDVLSVSPLSVRIESERPNYLYNAQFIKTKYPYYKRNCSYHSA